MSTIDLTSPSPKRGKLNEVLDLTTPVKECILLLSDSEEEQSSFYEEIQEEKQEEEKGEEELVEMMDSTSISDFAIEQILTKHGIKAKKSRKAMEDQLRDLWEGTQEVRSTTTTSTKTSNIDWDVVTAAIRRNPELYQTMLIFQPVELETVLEYLAQETPFKISKLKLIRYFDEQGVFFKSKSKKK